MEYTDHYVFIIKFLKCIKISHVQYSREIHSIDEERLILSRIRRLQTQVKRIFIAPRISHHFAERDCSTVARKAGGNDVCTRSRGSLSSSITYETARIRSKRPGWFTSPFVKSRFFNRVALAATFKSADGAARGE